MRRKRGVPVPVPWDGNVPFAAGEHFLQVSREKRLQATGVNVTYPGCAEKAFGERGKDPMGEEPLETDLKSIYVTIKRRNLDRSSTALLLYGDL